MTDLQGCILVVDDDEIDRETAGRYLREDFYVHFASSGTEALSCIEERRYACVLLDLGLPDLSGHELIEPIAKQSAVIMMTGQGDETMAVAAMKQGASDYLVKDKIDRESLLRAINGAIERHRLEEMIAEQQRRLLEDERLKVLIQLAGSSLLDLNEPITRLNLLLERLVQDTDRKQRDVDLLDDSFRALTEITTIMRRIQHMRLENAASAEASFSNSDEPVSPRSVLCIDNSPMDLFVLKGTTEQLAVELSIEKIETVGSVAEACAVLNDVSIDLIITDFQLDDGTALDVLRIPEVLETTLPVIVVSGSGSETIVAEVLRAGATDYISKQLLSRETLKTTMLRAFERASLRNELRKSQEKMHALAFTDELTQIYNRRFLTESMTREVNRITRHQGRAAFCLLDLDFFKKLNDTFGHAAGDHALRETANVLKNSVRRTDLVARYGGEEFAVFLPDADEQAAASVAESIRKNLADATMRFEGQALPVTASIGVALIDGEQERSVSEIIAAADTALYQAKNAGRNRVVVETTSS